jgi:hypothetical protein
MEERTQAAYEQSRKEAFRQMPLRIRAAAGLKAVAFTGAIAVLVFMIFAYPLFASPVASEAPLPALEREHLSKPLRVAQSWNCSPRKTCKAINSCEEALWYLLNCSWGGRLDGDSDGAPCEQLCGSNN